MILAATNDPSTDVAKLAIYVSGCVALLAPVLAALAQHWTGNRARMRAVESEREAWRRDQLHETATTFLVRADQVVGSLGNYLTSAVQAMNLLGASTPAEELAWKALDEQSRVTTEMVDELRRDGKRVALVGSQEVRAGVDAVLDGCFSIEFSLTVVADDDDPMPYVRNLHAARDELAKLGTVVGECGDLVREDFGIR